MAPERIRVLSCQHVGTLIRRNAFRPRRYRVLARQDVRTLRGHHRRIFGGGSGVSRKGITTLCGNYNLASSRHLLDGPEGPLAGGGLVLSIDCVSNTTAVETGMRMVLYNSTHIVITQIYSAASK